MVASCGLAALTPHVITLQCGVQAKRLPVILNTLVLSARETLVFSRKHSLNRVAQQPLPTGIALHSSRVQLKSFFKAQRLALLFKMQEILTRLLHSPSSKAMSLNSLKSKGGVSFRSRPLTSSTITWLSLCLEFSAS